MRKYNDAELQGDQLAPHSLEAEAAVLGCVLGDSEAVNLVIDSLDAADFFLVRNGWIWEAISNLYERRELIDHMTVAAELEQQGRLSEIGGAAYIVGLFNRTPSFINVEGYAAIVKRLAVRRRLIDASGEIVRLAHSDETDIDVVVDKSQAVLDAATADASDARVYTASQQASEHYDRTMALMRGENPSGECQTGLVDLDKLMGGFRPDNLYYIAGRPGMGKSSLLDDIIQANCEKGRRVVFLSLEMSSEEVTTRFLSRLTKVPFRVLADGRLNEAQTQAYIKAVDAYSKWPLTTIDDVTLNTPRRAQRRLRKLVKAQGAVMLVVDYIGLMDTQAENRNQELTKISRWLKRFAREMHIPVVVASQLNREVDSRQDKRPMLSDLRESGSLEQDADGVIFIYRDAYYYPESPDENKAELHLAKHRNGPTGIAEVIWWPEYMRFVDAAKRTVSLDDFVDPLAKAKAKPPEPAAQDYKAAAGGDKGDE